jgi:hypothetical protein
MLAEQPKENKLRLSCAICMDIMKTRDIDCLQALFLPNLVFAVQLRPQKSAPHVRENSALKM